VQVDWDREPFAELPYPNDLATRPDAASPTGLRVNLSTVARTQRSSEALEKLNEMAGFGTFAPITVAFEAPLDLDEVLRRHPDDFVREDAMSDDAFYVIDVTVGSPTYLQAAPLDIGHGRFPVDVPDTERFWINDPQAGSPSLIFDVNDEDLNGNGRLDDGEDVDGDRVLDIANVWPEGGDSRANLLSWYERSTNTLILRPVVPLRPATRYAVVLTNRLVGEGGQPIRSPWSHVNHTRQTDSLLPAVDAISAFGLTVDDVAFAWSFTTAPVTEELWKVTEGQRGVGPWRYLSQSYPVGVTEAHSVHEEDEFGDAWNGSVATVFEGFQSLGLVDDDEGGSLVIDTYSTYGGQLVGGAIESPWFMPDSDEDGSDADEYWHHDIAGFPIVEARRLPFTCVLPMPGDGIEPPYDVAVLLHGYGGSRFDALMLGWGFNRVGMAVCSIDHPGHGFTLDEDDRALVEPFLKGMGLSPLLHQMSDGRARDLNNDGEPDSGGDMFSADPFHSRDMQRQGVIDTNQMVESLRRCGEGRMGMYRSTQEGPESTSESRITCDWDHDGIVDIGGPGARVAVVGASLGAIQAGTDAALIDADAVSAIVPGGGILDMTMRSDIGGAVEAVIGRALSPAIVAIPSETGGFDIAQFVISVDDDVVVPFAHTDADFAGGRAEVENLANGEVREIVIPADSRFRVAIPADTPDAWEKGALAGIPATGAVLGENYGVANNDGLGDPLVVRLYDSSGAAVATWESFEQEARFEEITYNEDSPLVALSWGLGEQRTSPDLRRTVTVLSGAMEPGDPIVYARHWVLEPLLGRPANFLVQPTPGDTWVPINTGIALARAGGLVPWSTVDGRYGMSIDRFLIENRVVHGLEEFGPYTDDDGNPLLFDADDLDRGTDGTGAPSDDPLRILVETSSGHIGMRLPYVNPTGSHAWELPEPKAPFDVNTFAMYQSIWFAYTGEIRDDRCLSTADCEDWRTLEAP
jgi:hypothetical protein